MIETTVRFPQPFTREDLQLLRKATSVAFFREVHPDGETVCFIRLWCKVRKSARKGARKVAGEERIGDVPVSSTHTRYSAALTHQQGFASLHACRFSPRWLTVLALVKVGDELRLHWTQDANSATVERGGLHFDTLDAVILRQGKERYTVRLEDSICEDNSARMLTLSPNLTRRERERLGQELRGGVGVQS